MKGVEEGRFEESERMVERGRGERGTDVLWQAHREGGGEGLEFMFDQ